MDILLGKYGLIFTEFDGIDRGGASEFSELKPCEKYGNTSHHNNINSTI